MDKLKESFLTLFLAAQYSFEFCWRNCRKLTTARLVLTLLSTFLLYGTIRATGFLINSAQKLAPQFAGKNPDIGELMSSGLLLPVLFTSFVFVVKVVHGRLNWFFGSQWHQILRFANDSELQNHRATLDIACIQSKTYDDLQKRIQELPSGWNVRIFFTEEMFNLFSMMISFALFGTALMWHNPVYALILFATSLPMMMVEFREGNMFWNLFFEMVPHHKARRVLESPYHGRISFLQALMFNQHGALRKEIDTNTGYVIGRYNGVRHVGVKEEMITHSIAVVAFLGIVVHAVYSTISSAGELGTLGVVIATASTFQGNLDAMLGLISQQWNNAKGVVLIEKEFFGLKAAVQTVDPIIPDFDSAPRIRFDRVSFSYPEKERLVLKEVSFSIEPGSKVAIVGPSGHGKSTILALLMRHRDPTSGAIYADDINLQNISPNLWNEYASALTQDYDVLQRKLGEEIASSRLGEPIDNLRLERAVEFADFTEVVSSDPLGLDSQIGVEFGGRDFSGGERQRLALARVHYRGTPILIFDEPDAKLDPESAQKVIDEVFGLEGITVILITHHVSRAERCDKVIVIKDGEVAEQGHPSELMHENSHFAKLYRSDRTRLRGVHVGSE